MMDAHTSLGAESFAADYCLTIADQMKRTAHMNVCLQEVSDDVNMTILSEYKK